MSRAGVCVAASFGLCLLTVLSMAARIPATAQPPHAAVSLSHAAVSVSRNDTSTRPALNPMPPAPARASRPRVIDGAHGQTFRHHVIPVLTKMGCNAGACHGAAVGQNGFSLTLRGYDPEADYASLTRQAAGRRINRLEPAKSLVLLKPTEAAPHMGGKRFDVNSPEYRVIARWIAAGAPPPGAGDPRLTRLEVTPPRATIGVGERVAIGVLVHYSNGVSENVTRWVRYDSADEGIAKVDEHGVVTVAGHGETVINLSFVSTVSSVRISSPFPHKVPAAAYSRSPQFNFIDDLVLAKLRQLHIAPSAQAGDGEFIRRVYLDAIGTLPTPDEVEEFLAERRPDKRTRLVERVLARPEWVDYWTYKWCELLSSGNGSRPLYEWIHAAVASNTPWNRMAYELLTASGRSTENGAVNFFLFNRTPEDVAENVAQTFLGVNIGCARCHNHPLDRWTQRQYYAFANLFSRIDLKEDRSAGKFGAWLVTSSPDGELFYPKTGTPLRPTPLDGSPLPLRTSVDRRVYFAKWLTGLTNAPFARTVVNRVWANFFGRGLVHPVEDLRSTNPASNEDLFDAVTRDFAASGFDVKQLMRTIMLSAAYQRSAAASPSNAHDDRYYSRYLVRRLPAEVILDAISQVTGVPETFSGHPAGTRAMQLQESRVPSYFLTVFGRPERDALSAGERTRDPTLTQALHAINGDTISKKLQSPQGVLAKALRDGLLDEQIVSRLYLAALSRAPSAAERAQAMDSIAVMQKTGDDSARARQSALEDLAWALLTSKEFLFNH